MARQGQKGRQTKKTFRHGADRRKTGNDPLLFAAIAENDRKVHDEEAKPTSGSSPPPRRRGWQ